MAETMSLITDMAIRRRPNAVHLRPKGMTQGLAWDAIAGLPNPPTVADISRWTGLSAEQSKKAVERLMRDGKIASAGRIIVGGISRQSYRLADDKAPHA